MINSNGTTGNASQTPAPGTAHHYPDQRMYYYFLQICIISASHRIEIRTLASLEYTVALSLQNSGAQGKYSLLVTLNISTFFH